MFKSVVQDKDLDKCKNVQQIKESHRNLQKVSIIFQQKNLKLQEDLSNLRNIALSLFNVMPMPIIKEDLGKLQSQPYLYSKLIGQARDYLIHLQTQMQSQMRQAQLKEYELSIQVDEMKKLCVTRKIQLNVAFRKLVDLGQKVRCE